jgi:hypothetical protein
VFTLASIIAIAVTILTILLIPPVSRGAAAQYGLGPSPRRLWQDMGQVLRNLDFLRTIFFIGIPAKAVMTGIIVFALPLLLTQQEYAQEDIGQISMLYAVGVFVANGYVSRHVDRIGNTTSILFWGSTISGIGLLLIGLSGWTGFDEWSNGGTLANMATISGVLIVGIAHGFVNAPVITRVADSRLASKIGANSVTAAYRFLERVGHIAGPIIVGQLFIFAGNSTAVVTWVGICIVVSGVIFILSCVPAGTSTAVRETVHE